MSIVNNLPSYVEQNHDKLLRDVVLGASSAKHFTLQTGVKPNGTALNLLATNVVLQDGSTCGFNAAGTSTISQRIIKAPLVKVNMDFCEKTLLNSALQHEVRVAAGQKTLPFEQDFIADVIAQVALASEKLVWQGDTTKTTDNHAWDSANTSVPDTSYNTTTKHSFFSHSGGISIDGIPTFLQRVVSPVSVQSIIINLVHLPACFVVTLKQLFLTFRSQ
jgi:hypothetical protein